MSAPLDLSQKRFGKLTALARSAFNKHQQALWLCRCDCGIEKVIAAHALRQGLTKSCGCIRRETTARRRFKHGQSQTPEWFAWYNMIDRCYDQKNKHFKDYGQRGITVCDAWRESFEEFRTAVGARPSSEHSIDRINNDGNYEPGNCRWATPIEQALNRRPRKKA